MPKEGFLRVQARIPELFGTPENAKVTDLDEYFKSILFFFFLLRIIWFAEGTPRGQRRVRFVGHETAGLWPEQPAVAWGAKKNRRVRHPGGRDPGADCVSVGTKVPRNSRGEVGKWGSGGSVGAVPPRFQGQKAAEFQPVDAARSGQIR